MANIVLSSAVRQNLLSLQSTAQLMSTTQNRLATGRKVNTALDNPTNFFTSSSLRSRSNDLGALLDSMSVGIKTLDAASNGMTAITNTIETMQSTLRQARQDRSFQTASYTLDPTAIGTASAKNLTISGGAVTGSVNVALNTTGTGGTQAALNTTAAYAPPIAAQPATYTAAAGYVPPGAGKSVDLAIGYTKNGVTHTLNVNISPSEVTLQEAIDKINGAVLLDTNFNGNVVAQNSGGKLQIASTANEDSTISVGETLNGGATSLFGAAGVQPGSDGQFAFTVNGTAVTLTSASAPSLTTAINAANVQLQAANSAFEAYDAGAGKLGFRETTALGATLTLGGADAGLFTGTTNTGTAGTGSAVYTVDQLVTAISANVQLAGKVKATNDNGKLRIDNLSTLDLNVVGVSGTTGKIDGSLGAPNTTTIGGNDVRKNLAQQFNQLRDELDKIADDASFNGVNLLRGDTLKLNFNETGTSSIVVQAKDSNGNPTQVSAAALNLGQMASTDLDTDTSIDTKLDGLNNALNSVRSQASNFGSNLAIVQNRTDFTKSMINTLQTGADDLVLADTNEEAASLLALQTRQQLSTTALSLSAQADQAVLRLFG